ncbi:MAG: AAA family ATPase [Bacteroidales bacterium]|nr:AAA family ATPase [Bacteroidales bacterium]
MPTKWKQGFKAIGRVGTIIRGASYNETSETAINIVYVFNDAINRLDFLRSAPIEYYWCSNMPLIGIDDHANQTIRSVSGSSLCDIPALFCSINRICDTFKSDILKIEPGFLHLFSFSIPKPKNFPDAKSIVEVKQQNNKKTTTGNTYLPYLAALRTKPFMLLAGISGTGKSRIVREMAKACWKEGDPEYGKPLPRNFCMVQVKPNWHDSSELIGYVSRLNGEKFVVGPFLRFLAAALKEPDVPYFLCLDEMNLAPVEQYFAEYLSVIESRKLNPDGTITTDPIIEYENTDAYGSLIDQLFDTPEERKAYKTDDGGKRLSIPQNLFVVGTVNMDETTFSFSRKVLDRAMTIEMNEVDLHGGLEKGTGNDIGYIGNSIIGDAAEGCDVYEDNRELCDQVLAYLEQVNAILEGTPFKIAYRTRNEFLMYAVNRKALAPDSQLWQTLDEMTSMKILSRIEGDEERTKKVLDGLKALVDEQIVSAIPPAEEGNPVQKSISAAKIEEMQKKLQATGFTSYWA